MFPISFPSRLAALAAAVVLVCAAPRAEASVIYDVAVDGPWMDLSGSIETDALGTFTPAAFDASVTGYAITATLAGGPAFTFTPGHSLWGGPLWRALMSVSVTPERIELSATDRMIGLLRFLDGLFGRPNAPDLFDLLLQAAETPTLLATARPADDPPQVTTDSTGGGLLPTGTSSPILGAPAPIPEPDTLLLLGFGLVGLVVLRRRRWR